jgi:hypothetical protein
VRPARDQSQAPKGAKPADHDKGLADHISPIFKSHDLARQPDPRERGRKDGALLKRKHWLGHDPLGAASLDISCFRKAHFTKANLGQAAHGWIA